MKINKFVQNYFIDILFFIILLIFFLGGILAPAHTSADATGSGITASSDIPGLMSSMNMIQLTEGTPSPDFNLMSTAEEEISLKDQRGKVVLLSFWATW